jgi:transposase-like protein
MEKETYRNIEVMWLLGSLKPDHWTICKFRRENKELIRKAALCFRKFLKDNGFIEGKTIVFDGSKMKAYASREMLSEKSILNRVSNIENQLEKYLDNVEETDNLESILEEEAQEKEKLIKKLKQEKIKLENLKKQMEEQGIKYISPTDTDSRLMKSRDGKIAGYNIQTGVDAKHHMIVLAEVTSDQCDIKLLKEDYENLKEQLDIGPQEIIADKGYANIGQIKDICKNPETECYIPTPEPASKAEDKKNKIEFIYKEQENCYICPNKKQLHLIRKGEKKGGKLQDRYQCKDCEGCPIKHKCTTSKIGRIIYINPDQQWISEYRRRLEKPENLKKIKDRKSIVEHPHGTIKMIMGKFCFLLRKKPKVQVEMDIYSTIYNLKRLINIENMQYLLEIAKNYNWKLV